MLGERPPGGPGPPRPSLGGALPRPQDPRAPAPSPGPEFRGCFHLHRNFPGPLGCCDAPTNRREPAPAACPAPPRPRHANAASASDRIGYALFWGRGHADEGRRAGQRLAVAAAEPRGRWLEKAAGGASSSAVLGHSRNQSERFEASLGGAS